MLFSKLEKKKYFLKIFFLNFKLIYKNIKKIINNKFKYDLLSIK